MSQPTPPSLSELLVRADEACAASKVLREELAATLRTTRAAAALREQVLISDLELRHANAWRAHRKQ